jgi:hypothetical protein
LLIVKQKLARASFFAPTCNLHAISFALGKAILLTSSSCELGVTNDCPQTVREFALALPEVEEHDHWGRPSFRVTGKILAALWPDEQRAMIKVPPAEKAALLMLDPATFYLCQEPRASAGAPMSSFRPSSGRISSQR